jgi:hypothetical protein
MFVKEYTSYENSEYPDFGCSYESYTNAEILEMETLSPLYNLDSKATVSHTEVWSFYENVNIPASDNEADELAEKYAHSCDLFCFFPAFCLTRPAIRFMLNISRGKAEKGC